MALVTDDNRQGVQDTLDKVQESMKTSIELMIFMEAIKKRIEDKNINDATDWDVIKAAYTPDYDEILGRLKTIVESLPRWSVV